MRKFIRKLHYDQGGSVYIEMALLIIGVAMAVAPYMLSLGSTLGDKVQDIKIEVEQVGI